MQLSTTLAVGFLLGMRHATDADHVLTVGTLARRGFGLRGALLQAGLWGLGHTATVLALGAAIVLGHVVVPPRATNAMELAVAAMLIALGLVGLRSSNAESRSVPRMRALTVGVVHGAAGSAGIALLALATIQDRASALGYLAVFAVGSLIGMMVLTAALVAPFVITRRFEGVHGLAMRFAAVGSIALGGFLGARVLLGAS
jgi:high-affinity nickel-transport protein